MYFYERPEIQRWIWTWLPGVDVMIPKFWPFSHWDSIPRGFSGRHDMGCACMPSPLFTSLPLLRRRPPPHFPAAGFHPFPSKKLTPSHPFRLSALPLFSETTGGSNNNNNSNGGGGGNWGYPFDSDDSNSDSSSGSRHTLFLSLLFSSLTCCLCQLLLSKFAIAKTRSLSSIENDAVWEVKGGNWTKLIPDHVRDAFVASNPGLFSELSSLNSSQVPSLLWNKCRDLLVRVMLPEGFPKSVTSDYLEYSLWRGVQGVASQVSGVLATQALLYAVGLGKGAIPTAAAINWVLKDGIGYLSKIMLSDFGRHFDVNPKGWRLFADLLENAAFGLEICTPAFPNLFVFIGAVAGASRSAAALIQVIGNFPYMNLCCRNRPGRPLGDSCLAYIRLRHRH